MDEKERKKKEIRERLEAELNQKKKKGFMTPERKKKLRQLLRKKAAEELKREQEMKQQERKRVIEERTGRMPEIKEMDTNELIKLCEEFYSRIRDLDSCKFDLELSTCHKEVEINELAAKVNDVRGRFIIPPLKKISKTATQLEKMRQWTMKLAKLDMKGSLKPVKKDFNKELDLKK